MYYSLNFENNFLPTPSFTNWVIECYKFQHQKISVCKDILVANLFDVSLQKGMTSTKT